MSSQLNSFDNYIYSYCFNITRILGLPQEYWRSKILFAIARGIGIPLSLDDATISKSLGDYARVLVDLDLAS